MSSAIVSFFKGFLFEETVDFDLKYSTFKAFFAKTCRKNPMYRKSWENSELGAGTGVEEFPDLSGTQNLAKEHVNKKV